MFRKAAGILFLFLLVMIVSGCTNTIRKITSTEEIRLLTVTEAWLIRLTDEPKTTLETKVANIRTSQPATKIIPPSTGTPTPTTTLTPTFKPIAIQNLTLEQKKSVMDFLAEKDGCPLPCWNGITPGVSVSSELQGFFARLGYDFGFEGTVRSQENGEEAVEMRDFPSGSFQDPLLVIYMQWEKRIVNLIEINLWDHPEQVNVNRLNEVLGTPDRILVYQDQGMLYRILFEYANKNLIVEIRGIRHLGSTNKPDLPFQVCINDHEEQTIRAVFYGDNVIEKINEAYGDYPWLEWASLMNITKEELFAQLQIAEGCLPYP